MTSAKTPKLLVFCAIVLVVIGCVAIARYDELTGGSGRFLKRQIVWAVVALVAGLVAATIDYRVFIRYAYPLFFLSIILLVAVYFTTPINSARRWLRVGPIGIQPSEFAKIVYLFAVGRFLMYRVDQRRLVGLVMPLLLTLVPVVLILKEPDLGTSLVFLPLFFVVAFVSGARRRDLLGAILVGLAIVPLFWTQMSTEQRSRVTSLFHQPAPGEKVDDDSYQLDRAKQLAALGGMWGSAISGQSVDDPAAYRLPEAHSDFIACVVCERFGVLGLGLLLLLYATLIAGGLMVSAACREPFGRLLAAGLMAIFAIEVVINIGMTVGLLPVTGLALPLVSYGGSNLTAHAIMIGLVVSVARHPGYDIADEPFQFAA
ncbi:MAG: FtsW/RodA/SpoVE family cell cycle protein [Planctomycetia bacterium]|jgi:cell division protein FtsW (lipid II flippase)